MNPTAHLSLTYNMHVVRLSKTASWTAWVIRPSWGFHSTEQLVRNQVGFFNSCQPKASRRVRVTVGLLPHPCVLFWFYFWLSASHVIFFAYWG